MSEPDWTKPIELYNSDGEAHEAVSVLIEGDRLVRRKSAKTPFYWRWGRGGIRPLTGSWNQPWAVRNVAPRLADGTEIVPGMIYVGGLSGTWTWKVVAVDEGIVTAASWNAIKNVWCGVPVIFTANHCSKGWRRPTPADFAPNTRGEAIPLSDIPAELRDAVQALRNGTNASKNQRLFPAANVDGWQGMNGVNHD